jgi:uncharacterized repeat protein (TIGR03837 family)
VRRDFLASIGVATRAEIDDPVSVFCYPGSPLLSLMSSGEKSWPSHRSPLWLIPEATAASFPELATLPSERYRLIPFLSQDDYDRLLLSCELNFVRGEDSFVRAQLAGRPFVWQAYRQAEAAHLQKLDAFLGRYLTDANPPMAATVYAMFGAWNGCGPVDEDVWPPWWRESLAISDHNQRWLHRLESSESLGEKLVNFCESRL